MARAAWLSCDLSEGDFECLIGSAVSRRFSVADEASGGASSRERAERWTWRMLVVTEVKGRARPRAGGRLAKAPVARLRPEGFEEPRGHEMRPPHGGGRARPEAGPRAGLHLPARTISRLLYGQFQILMRPRILIRP